MKKSSQFLGTFLMSGMLLLFLMVSCGQQEHLSIDESKSAAAWAEENKTTLATYSRSKIATYDRKYQKAILGVLEPARKKVLWQEKVDHILSLELSKGERQLLAWYAEQFKHFDYNTPTSPEVQEALHEKTQEGMQRFGWSKALVYELFFVLQDVDPNTLGNARVDHFTHAPNEGGGGNENPICDCIYDLGCPGGNGYCTDHLNCTNTQTDCGFWGNSDCNGVCNR